MEFDDPKNRQKKALPNAAKRQSRNQQSANSDKRPSATGNKPALGDSENPPSASKVSASGKGNDASANRKRPRQSKKPRPGSTGLEPFGGQSSSPAEATEGENQYDSVSLWKIFNPIGAHQVLTDSLIEEFCRELETCIFDELAAAAVDMSVNSLKEWLRMGRRVHDFLWHSMQTYCDGTESGNAKFEENVKTLTESDWQVYKLFVETKKAKATGTRDDLDFISRARSKDWKAAAYRLKIRDRARFGDTHKTEQNISVESNGQTFKIQVVDYADWVMGDEGDEPIEVEAIEE